MRITLPLHTHLNIKNLYVILIRGKLATRLLGRKQELVGKFSKWTIEIHFGWKPFRISK